VTKREQKRYRQRLLAIGKRVQGDFSDIANDALRRTGGEASGGLSNAPFHLADLSNDTMEHEVAVGLLENQGFLLEQVSAALDRLDKSSFGTCQECGQPIPAERLEAIPYTPHCVNCATRLQAGSA
jgi:DnaK suppressor protein